MLQDDGTLLHVLKAARQSLAFMADADLYNFLPPDLIRDLEWLRSLAPCAILRGRTPDRQALRRPTRSRL